MTSLDNSVASQVSPELRAFAEHHPVGRLLGSLMIGRKKYKPSAPDGGREAIYDDLRAIIEFVSTVIPQRPDVVQPLRELLYGLKDLERGTVVPLLKPAKLRGRPLNSYSEELLRADAAVLMDLKQQAGVDRGVAANMVARDFNKHGYRDGGKKITGKCVIAWRNKVKENAGTSNLAVARRFSFALTLLEKSYPNEPKEAYAFYADRMRDMDPAEILKKGGS